MFFDIDGTLLLTDGAGRAALETALVTVYGTSGRLEGYTFHGKTDPLIIIELMASAGLEAAQVRERMPSMWPVYLEALEGELEVRRAEGRITLLPGIAELLETLEGMADISLGLLTGNIEEAAKLKLASAGVTTRFDVCAYASDAQVRSEIARIALERSMARAGGAEPMAVVVIGDTPEDIACARVMNARSVAVATGRHQVAELEAAGADYVFSDFSDTEAVLSSILSPLAADGAYDGAPGIGGTQ